MLRIATRQAMDDASCTVVRWQRPQLRVYAIQAEGVVFESLPLAPRGALVPPLIGHQLTCVLRGEFVSRRGDRARTVRAGAALLEPTMTWNERWTGRPFHAVLVDWDPALLPVQRTEEIPLGPAAIETATALFDRVLSSDDAPENGVAIVRGASVLLQRLGLGRWHPDPSDDPSALVSPSDVRATARWLSAIRTDVRSASFKRASTLTGLGERQLRRRYEELARVSGLPTNLRTVLVADRLVAALRLLGGAAPIGEVASAAGFGSTRALGLALDHAEMPSASEIRRLVRSG